MESMIVMAASAIGTYVILAGYRPVRVRTTKPNVWSRFMNWFRGG